MKPETANDQTPDGRFAEQAKRERPASTIWREKPARMNAQALETLKGILSDPVVIDTQDDKDRVIQRYGPVFAPDNIRHLTADVFRGFLFYRNNRHWHNLHRHGAVITADMGRLKKALAILGDESIPISKRLDDIRPSPGKAMVKGLGPAVITAILQVKHPDKYGVLNKTAETGMRAVGLWPAFSKRASFGGQYEVVNQVLHETAAKIGVDLWTLDALWSRWRPTNFSALTASRSR